MQLHTQPGPRHEATDCLGPGERFSRPRRQFLLFAVVIFMSTVTGYAAENATARSEERPTSSEGPHCVIQVAPAATDIERLAATELAGYLKQLYPGTGFEVQTDGAADILVGTPLSMPRLNELLGSRTPEAPEGYLVTHATVDGRPTGILCGTDPAGVLYGAYGLLRDLGVGYLLNGDTLPEPTTKPFPLSNWNLSDRPLVPTRVVFNWHNFLSGCSTWDVEQWQQWITQSQKMGYNTVMVHAYGNNPMAGFKFEGVQKPVGYLSSTQVGRDWSTNHVNDVRRLDGGEVFDTAVFGCDAAVNGTNLQRTQAAQALMAEAFATAEARAVDLFFAVDVDTTSANPQAMIEHLPKHARFEIGVKEAAWMGQASGKMWLVNPETPEGYGFYRAQVQQLLDAYPQIDSLVVWHRKSSTPWMEFALESMPKAWQEEFAAEVAKTPDAMDFYHSHHLFAQAKIVIAFQRAVTELGHDDVKIAFGSWDFDFLPAAHRFMPSDVALIPLDWMVLKDASVFDTHERRLAVAKVAATRPVIPIAWAHHDDGNYVGRPYTPIPNFHDCLTEMKCQTAGFGIIHWTTKPLDLYFQSLINQVWRSSENESLERTCRQMAQQFVGDEQTEPFAAYLQDWVTTMPKIGRETSDFFIDHELKDLPGTEAAQRRRLKLLNAIDRSELDATGNAWVDYFTGLEKFILDIYRTENAFHLAKNQHLAGQIDAARTTMATCQPEEVIERFANFSQHGGLTRGEKGLIVSMNTRWLPHYVRFRQMLATEPVRYNFAPTSHDLLAQSRGVFTFHFDDQGDMWQCLGSEETDAKTFAIDAVRTQRDTAKADAITEAICRTGIESDKPIELTLQPILPRGGRSGLTSEKLAAGEYLLMLMTIEPDEAAGVGDHVVDLRVEVAQQGASSRYQLAPTRAKHLRLQCRGSDKSQWNSIHEIRCEALDRSGPVTASGQNPHYAPENTVDGKNDTRWAVEGSDHWIQLTLDPKRSFDRLEIDWYDGASRLYDFDILCSDDGETWQTVSHGADSQPQGLLALDRIDVVDAAGGSNKALTLSYPVKLINPSTLRLTLTPVSGKVRICGAILTPLNELTFPRVRRSRKFPSE
ncbi:discoidin domain-containing protein [Novipirellula artificiosorum]|uniref:F5/8 type C domain protein n=1 Tax=Novipirellula artificiosorum TaxID=2528016 RepID=A0A5C6DYV2_9BACT|nr:discoidin domain-containing protein [Novipirellula artificiosorum]TWU40591.1 F5/8 type C domain protein [Novipirellula artificiosorum]